MDVSDPRRIGISKPDLFSVLCSLTSFATNSEQLLTIGQLTPAEAPVLCSLLTSGVEITHLTIQTELPPGTAAALSLAINSANTIHTLSLGDVHGPGDKLAPELLRAFAVSSNPALEQLKIFHLRIEDGHLCDSFTALRRLAVTGAGCYYGRVMLPVEGIGKLRALESLDIFGHDLFDSGAEALVAAVRDLPMVANLRICSAKIGVRAGRSIGSLVALGRVSKLDLSFNQLGDGGVSAMSSAILASPRHRCELQELNLNSNGIGPEGGEKIAELVAHSPRLQALSTSRNHIGGIAASALKLRKRSLEKLDVSYCNLGSHETTSLLNVLRGFPALSVLMMGWNSDGMFDTRAITRLLGFPGRCALTELGLQMSYINEAGALELAAAFARTYSLRSINMENNPLGPRGASAIISALDIASTQPMDMMNFSLCGIGDDGASAAGRLISHRGCKYVFLEYDVIRAVGAKSIADSVAASACVVEHLSLSKNPLGDEGVRYLLVRIAQRKGRFAREIDIRDTSMGVNGAMAVKRAIDSDGVIDRLFAGAHSGDEEADRILQGVVKWESVSKPAGAAILVLLGVA